MREEFFVAGFKREFRLCGYLPADELEARVAQLEKRHEVRAEVVHGEQSFCSGGHGPPPNYEPYYPPDTRFYAIYVRLLPIDEW